MQSKKVELKMKSSSRFYRLTWLRLWRGQPGGPPADYPFHMLLETQHRMQVDLTALVLDGPSSQLHLIFSREIQLSTILSTRMNSIHTTRGKIDEC